MVHVYRIGFRFTGKSSGLHDRVQVYRIGFKFTG